MANPAYGISIRPEEILNDSIQAQNDSQQRKDFFAKSLNVYTNSIKAYFNIDEFRRSDKKYDWTLDQLRRLPIKWYGGADLSKLHDLTWISSSRTPFSRWLSPTERRTKITFLCSDGRMTDG